MKDQGAFIGAFIVLVVISVVLQLLFLVRGAALLNGIQPEYLSAVPEQESFVFQTRMFYVISTWMIVPYVVGWLTAAYTYVGLEYLFTLVDVVLGLILVWYVIAHLNLRKRSASISSGRSPFGTTAKFDPSSHRYDFDESNIVPHSIRIKRDTDFSGLTPPRATAVSPLPMRDSGEFDDLIFALQGPDAVSPTSAFPEFPGRSGTVRSLGATGMSPVPEEDETFLGTLTTPTLASPPKRSMKVHGEHVHAGARDDADLPVPRPRAALDNDEDESDDGEAEDNVSDEQPAAPGGKGKMRRISIADTHL